MKTKIITWLVTLSAFIDVVYGVISDNSGLLAELGASPKATKIILALGLIWNAFNKSITPNNLSLKKGDGAGVPDKPL